jgi:hypothetical protein
MTYNQMTKILFQIDQQIEFLFELQKMAPNTAQEIHFGRIIENLTCYKNYLKYEKEYVEKGRKHTQ